MDTTLLVPDVDDVRSTSIVVADQKRRSARSTNGLARRVGVAVALAAADAMAAVAGLVGGSLLARQSIFDGRAGVPDVVAFPALACFMFAAAGLYGGYGPSPAERLRLRTHSVVALTLASLVFLSGLGLTTRTVAGLATASLLLLIASFYAEFAIRHILIRRGLWGARTVIVGTDACGITLANTLLAQPELGFTPVGFVAVLPDAGREHHNDNRHTTLPLIGTIEDATLQSSIEVAIFCSSADFTMSDLAHPGPLPFPRVVVVQQTQDLQSLWMQTRTLGSYLGLEIRRDLYRPGNLHIKRFIDRALTWPAVILAAPLIAALALAIKIVDPGPSFYVQQRVGRSGRPIRILKLRSMYVDAERRLDAHLEADPKARSEWQRYFKLTHDPRILPGIGSFIRRTSLDELPQLWNVVRGELSLVGPRPFPSYHTDGFDPRFQALRRSVPPGLTGLWQVSSRSDGDLTVQKSQDTFYIRNWSIWLDFYILLATIPAVVKGSGAR